MLVVADKTIMSISAFHFFIVSFGFISTPMSISLELAMKNFSIVVNHTLDSFYQAHHTSPDYGHRQGRTYGPLMSFLLATFLTKAVAKFAASSLLPISNQPWLTNKPVNYLSFNQIHQPHQIWKPASPYLHGLTAFGAEGIHDHYSAPDPLEIDDHHTTSSTLEVHGTPSTIAYQNAHSNQYRILDTTIESPDTFDQMISQSQYNYRRQPAPQRWNVAPRRGFPPPRRDYANRFPSDLRNRYQTNRYKTTTPYYDYYDNYEDLATRPAFRPRPPIRRRPTTENYDIYDNSEYDDSLYDDYYEKTTRYYDRTTKPYKKRRKSTKKSKVKKRTEVEDYNDSDESIEQLDDQESKEISKEVVFKPKPRQAATTTTKTTTSESSTTTETTESTTTESSTTTKTPSTTTQSSQNATKPTGYGQGGNYDHISFTYGPPVAQPPLVHQEYGPPHYHHGYGPSNGNEGISITQNPNPFPLFYHNFPYTNLLPQELTKNAIVQKVHDIVGYEHDFVQSE